MSSHNRHLMVRDSAPLAQTTDVYSYSSPEVEQIELSRVLDVLRRRFWLMLGTLVLVLAVGTVYTLRQKPIYESTALMLVAPTQPVAVNTNDVGVMNDVAALTRSRSVQSQLELLTSANILNATAERLGEEELQKGFGARGLPQWSLGVDSKKDSDVISVTAKAYDPEVAANLANTLVTTYIERDQDGASQASRQGRLYVSSELDSVNKQLNAARKELSDYKRKTKLVVADDQLRAMAGNMVSLQIEQDKANIEVAAAQREEQMLRKQLADQGQVIQASSTIQLSPEYQEALNTIAKLHSQRATLMAEYTPGSTRLRDIDRAIAEATQMMNRAATMMAASKVQARNPMIDNYVGSIVSRASADARLRALKSVVSKRDSQIDALPEQERTFTRLMERVTVLGRTSQMLSDKYYTLLINEKSTLPNARFASTAYASPAPATPNKKKNAALFFLLGAMLSVGVAAVAERLDRRIRYEDVITRLTGETPLSVIPNLKGSDRANLQLDSVDQDSSFVESFRVLRNVLSFGNTETPLKLIAVTSPGRAEGKSTTSINLAVAAAISGKRVLVVDCDLRRPSIHKRTSLNRNVGFTNLVKGLISIDDAVTPTRIENLFCLPAGPLPPNPAEFLNSKECRALFEQLAERFDWVIMDCPPCAGLSDMQVVSTIADGILLVVSVNQTLTDSLQDSVKVLSQVNAPYIGSVVNRLDVKHSRYDYYRRIEDVELDDTTALTKVEDQVRG